MAAEYLIECGHKDLALASGPITRHNRREILRGFKQALLDYDIVFNKRRIVNYDSNYDIYNIGDDQGAIQIIDKMFEEEYVAVAEAFRRETKCLRRNIFRKVLLRLMTHWPLR